MSSNTETPWWERRLGTKEVPHFRCIVPAGAAPCVEDSRFDPDLNGGKVDGINGGVRAGKVRRKLKQGVKMGERLPWVGVESRDQFEPINDAARKLNELDEKILRRVLEGWDVDIPEDATLGELGKAYNRHDPRLEHCFAKYGLTKTKSRTFGKKKAVKAISTGKQELEGLRAWLKAQGVPFHHNAGVETLRKLKESKLKEPDKE